MFLLVAAASADTEPIMCGTGRSCCTCNWHIEVNWKGTARSHRTAQFT